MCFELGQRVTGAKNPQNAETHLFSVSLYFERAVPLVRVSDSGLGEVEDHKGGKYLLKHQFRIPELKMDQSTVYFSSRNDVSMPHLWDRQYRSGSWKPRCPDCRSVSRLGVRFTHRSNSDRSRSFIPCPFSRWLFLDRIKYFQPFSSRRAKLLYASCFQPANRWRISAMNRPQPAAYDPEISSGGRRKPVNWRDRSSSADGGSFCRCWMKADGVSIFFQKCPGNPC